MCGRPVGTCSRRIRRRGRRSAGRGRRRPQTRPRPPWPTSRSERGGRQRWPPTGARRGVARRRGRQSTQGPCHRKAWSTAGRSCGGPRSPGGPVERHRTGTRPASHHVHPLPPLLWDHAIRGPLPLAWHGAAPPPRPGAPWRLRRQERGTRWPEHAGRYRPVSSLPLVTSRADVGLSVCGRPHGVLLPRCPHPVKDRPYDTP